LRHCGERLDVEHNPFILSLYINFDGVVNRYDEDGRLGAEQRERVPRSRDDARILVQGNLVSFVFRVSDSERRNWASDRLNSAMALSSDSPRPSESSS
jgi:hypothetical protein